MHLIDLSSFVLLGVADTGQRGDRCEDFAAWTDLVKGRRQVCDTDRAASFLSVVRSAFFFSGRVSVSFSFQVSM